MVLGKMYTGRKKVQRFWTVPLYCVSIDVSDEHGVDLVKESKPVQFI